MKDYQAVVKGVGNWSVSHRRLQFVVHRGLTYWVKSHLKRDETCGKRKHVLEFKVQQIYPSDTYPGYQAGTDPKSHEHK